MRKHLRTAIAAMAMAPILATAPAHDQARAAQADAAKGQELAFDRGKGNCLACHTMKGSDVPSNVGPELSNIKKRYPNAKDLYAILYDEEKRNPQTVMPAFGKNLMLTPQEINDIIAFLYTE